jgi:Flp pilus assembly protein TadD
MPSSILNFTSTRSPSKSTEDTSPTRYPETWTAAPDFRPALEAYGQALLKKGDAERAVAALERAVRLAPGWPDARVLLGRAYMAAGRRDDAQREFAEAQRLSDEERARLEEKVSAPKTKKRKKP